MIAMIFYAFTQTSSRTSKYHRTKLQVQYSIQKWAVSILNGPSALTCARMCNRQGTGRNSTVLVKLTVLEPFRSARQHLLVLIHELRVKRLCRELDVRRLQMSVAMFSCAFPHTVLQVVNVP